MLGRVKTILAVWFIATLTPTAHAADVDFVRDVRPVLEQHCLRCHRPGNEKGDLSLATVDGLRENDYLSPGRPDDSHLLLVIAPGPNGERPQMPKEGDPLTEAERDVLTRWVAAGAEWPADLILKEPSLVDRSWWSFQPLKSVEPPQTLNAPAEWQVNPIDRFVFSALEAKSLSPSPRASNRELIRRATYDLLGLPPTPEEIEAFIADETPDAWERLIDRLLQSPHYGERWGRHWLDVVRFGESRGYERNEIINNAWPFRDYVIRSFNADKPFDQFVREQLAGDVIGRDDPEVRVGTTFLVCGTYDDVTNLDAAQAAQIRANTIDDIIRGTTEAFLGLTVGCARCHDHKFDPIAQTDYYALYATFADVSHGDQEVATPQSRKERADRVAPLEESRGDLQREIDAIKQQVRERAEEQGASLAQQWTRPPASRVLTEETFEPVNARFVRLVVEGVENNPASANGYRLDEFEIWTAGENSRNVALVAGGGRATGDSRTAEDFADAYSPTLVIDGEFGNRWVPSGPELTIELPDVHTIDRATFSSDRYGESGTHVVANFLSEYRIETSLDGISWTKVADSYDRLPVNDEHRRYRLDQAVTTSEERQKVSELRRALDDVARELSAVPPLPRWWVGKFAAASGPFHVFVGGDPMKPGEAVTPASLALVEGIQPAAVDLASTGEARRALAEWIVDSRNPLTSRVLANRVWQYHIGTGLVATPSDFGAMGGLPTHPELLDWLAQNLSTPEAGGGWGWRLKPLHKLIMMSQAYQQSSDDREEARAVDADSRYLWRFPPRRLSAEEIRDSMLSIAGKLDTQMGGPGFRLYQYLEDNVATYVPLDRHGPETYRRAVYHQHARASVVDLMSDFDCPDPAFAAPRRAATTTPLQALTLMNHSFTLDMAGALAGRLEREVGSDHNEQVERAFVLAFGRPPEPVERDASLELIDAHGLAAFCRVLMNTNEFIYVP